MNKTLALKPLRLVLFSLLGVALATAAAAQVSREARREAARFERLVNNIWEAMVEDVDFGRAWDQRALLDVFNLNNGARYLSQQMEDQRARSAEIGDTVELLLLQSEAVERSVRQGRPGRMLLRNWEDAKASLDALARLFPPARDYSRAPGGGASPRDNINELRIEITEVRHAGNIFGNDYRIRGVISGRNMVSAGIYKGDRMLKSIPLRYHDSRLSTTPFDVRVELPSEGASVRVIDNRRFVLEQPIEVSGGGGLPGFK